MMKPVPGAGTAPYWEGIRNGELRLQRCGACGAVVFYPRAACPRCLGSPLRGFTSAGTGHVYSYTVAHCALREFSGQAPFTVALVDLDEGVRMMARIVDADPGSIRIGMPVRMTVMKAGDATVPCFRPDGEPGPAVPGGLPPGEWW
jgi:hypothetical protein